MSDGARPHIPVMLPQVLEALAPGSGEIHIDGTFGAGGYSRGILDTPGTRVIAIDRDPTAIKAGQSLVEEMAGRLTLMHGPFSSMEELAAEAGHTKVHGVVLDVGVSSMQLDRAERGFSFHNDGPLDMRMAIDGVSAADIVNDAKPEALQKIFSLYGEERRARTISLAIAEKRKERPFRTTRDLAGLIEETVPRGRPGDIHPATRVFQALRIFINRELEELADALCAAERMLVEGGRLVVVAFHSLEDRIVKRFFQERAGRSPRGSRHQPGEAQAIPSFAVDRVKAVPASDAEIAVNPRSRSAKMRVGVRTSAPGFPFNPKSLGVPDPGPYARGLLT